MHADAATAADVRRRARPRAWRAHPRWFAALLVFAAASVPLTAVHTIPLTAECVILACLVAYTAVGRDRAFAWWWTAWLGGVVLLDDLRSLQRVVGAPHAGDVVAFTRRLFGGGLPVVDLQRHWAVPSTLTAHDIVLSGIYLMHSPAPLLCGAALWRWRREWFGPFVVSILVAATVGLVVYLAFPEMPPWLAAQNHLIPPVRRITDEVMAHAGPLSSVYGGADPLPDAAMPSLHVAYPCIVAFWAIVAFGRRAWWLVLYPLTLAVGVVYLGEHWAIDVVAGVIVAVGAVAVAARTHRRVAGRP